MVSVIPQFKRMLAELAVVITAVASDLFSDEMGDFYHIGGIAELDFSNDKAIVFAMKLIDFEGVVATLDEPAGLVDYAGFTELHELLSINKRNLLLELIAGESVVRTGPFNSNVCARISNSNANSTATLTADIALLNVAFRKSLVLERIVKHEVFAFNLLSHTDYIIKLAQIA